MTARQGRWHIRIPSFMIEFLIPEIGLRFSGMQSGLSTADPRVMGTRRKEYTDACPMVEIYHVIRYTPSNTEVMLWAYSV